MLPTIDPAVRFVGTSFLRTLNAETLRALTGAVVIQDNDQPLVVIIPYETYLDWQDDDREPARLMGQLGGALAGSLRKKKLVAEAPKQSKKAAAIEALKASDPMSAERPEIEYGSDELPSAGSVGVALAMSSVEHRGPLLTEIMPNGLTLPDDIPKIERAVEDWRSKRAVRGPIPKPGKK